MAEFKRQGAFPMEFNRIGRYEGFSIVMPTSRILTR